MPSAADPADAAEHAPRSWPLLCAIAPAAVLGSVGAAVADTASLSAGVRLSASHWTLPALGVAGLVGLWLVRRGRAEPPGLSFARSVLLAALLAATPHLFQAFDAGHARMLVALGALLGLLVAPCALAVALALRASSRAGEEFLFQRRGLSRAGVVALIACVLVGAGVQSGLGAARTLLAGAILILLWAPGLLAGVPKTGRRSRALVGVAVSLLVGAAAAFAARPFLDLPTPKTSFEQGLVESLPRPTPRTTLWVRPTDAGALVRVHDPVDLPIYENFDDRRLSDALVHPVAQLAKLERVLVLGGESGGVAEQILRYPEAREVVHVSLFPGLARAFIERRVLQSAHNGALRDPRVRIVEVDRVDALPAALAQLGQFSLVIAGTSAPFAAIKWVWSAQGRKVIADRVAPGGYLVGRLTSASDTNFPWCFVQELARDGWNATGYRVVLPSSTMDEVLLVLATRQRLEVERLRKLRVPARTLTNAHLQSLFAFGVDQSFRSKERTGECVDDLGVK